MLGNSQQVRLSRVLRDDVNQMSLVSVDEPLNAHVKFKVVRGRNADVSLYVKIFETDKTDEQT